MTGQLVSTFDALPQNFRTHTQTHAHAHMNITTFALEGSLGIEDIIMARSIQQGYEGFCLLSCTGFNTVLLLRYGTSRVRGRNEVVVVDGRIGRVTRTPVKVHHPDRHT